MNNLLIEKTLDGERRINEIKGLIYDNENFVVTSHVSPDGDNIGSSLAMVEMLKELNKNVQYIIDDDYPTDFEFMLPRYKQKSEELSLDNYILVVLDTRVPNRVAISKDIMDNAKHIIFFDHHQDTGELDNERITSLIDSNSSSTCELLGSFIMCCELTFGELLIYKDIAEYLLLGITTDTGNFSYPCVTDKTHYIANILYERGATNERIIFNLQMNKNFNVYKLLGEALGTLEIIDNYIGIMTVTQEMLKRNDVKYQDIGILAPYTKNIKGVEIGLLIKEKENNVVVVSLRSKFYIDCNKIAKVFGGGGHVRASGATFKGKDINSIKKELIEVIKTEWI